MDCPKPLSIVVRTIGTSFAVAALGVSTLCAQTYPSRPIRFVNPSATGIGPDLFYRMVGEGISAALGQPVVQEYRAGAAGQIALDIMPGRPRMATRSDPPPRERCR